jgi:g-D-glutamyl-meso-diaminopimelate peptidase
MLHKRVIQLGLVMVLLVATFAITGKAEAWSYCGSTYVVQRGDWLAKIARRCGVTLSALYAANPWVGRYIYPGQVLAIPGGYDGYDHDGFCGASYDSYGSYYIVCRGDTLGRIASYYGTNWRYLQHINGIVNPNRIYPGQVIRIY